ncbi:hypothetical protein L2725_08640 [Shewanella corallii]|uniref:Pilus assembly protein n=1 Tax=Shewanella corallii TaxID=560080 RepID=A0ABT0N600_9GAMM|nr:hypothetical protein [Shewanella corallii]MCL2913859.1 hypothetical protein [Shewanella corallii]
MTNRKQKGQSLVEMSVAVAFVVIPLLVLLPFISKLTGMQHRADQAAHYTAWERTVWYNSAPSRMPNVSGVYAARRTETDIAKQLPWRIYQRDGNALFTTSQREWSWQENLHPMLRVQLGERGQLEPLLADATENAPDEDELAKFTGLQSSGSQLPGSLGRAVGTAVNLLSFTGFRLEQDQFYQTRVESQLEQLDLEPFDELTLNISGNSALLATGWNAAGPHHLKNRSERLVLTNYMNNGVIRWAQRLLGILPFGRELRPSSLKLGHLEPDVLPQNRLCNYGSRDCGER